MEIKINTYNMQGLIEYCIRKKTKKEKKKRKKEKNRRNKILDKKKNIEREKVEKELRDLKLELGMGVDKRQINKEKMESRKSLSDSIKELQKLRDNVNANIREVEYGLETDADKQQLKNEKEVLIKDYNSLKRNEEEITKKISKMMKVSTRINLDRMKDALSMDSIMFNNKIFDWAEEFGFKIDGDYIDIDDADIEGFISSLDKQFELWENMGQTKQGKV